MEGCAMETLSDRVFEWVQHEFALRLGVCERSIHRDTPLARFLPPERRREFWTASERELGLRFPTLELPPAMRFWGHVLALGSAMRSLAVGVLFGAKWLVVPLFL